MTKIDIFSGFLGAGKTTLIKKLIAEAYKGEKLVLIENEFGETGIDGGFMKESGIQVNEMNSGCICCSLVGDFTKALAKVLDEYAPDRILIEPSGVGKLSDVTRAVLNAENGKAKLNAAVTVVDAAKCRMYMKNFGEFFLDQVEHAGTVILSRTSGMAEDKLEKCVAMLREHNAKAAIITTPWEELDGAQILAAMESTKSLEDELAELLHEEEHEHHHDHDEHDHCCDHDHDEHEHDHDHDHDDHEHEHHHDHDEHDHCCDHDHDEHEHHHDNHDEHDHDHGDGCTCGCHDHDHHHHHADEVFTSWGRETIKKYTKENLEKMLEALSASDEYGIILRAKGMLPAEDGTWIYFDMVPEETEIREGAPEYTGRLCVIGSKLNEDKLAELFGL